jgi:glutamate:GABA antiporter
MFVRRRWQTRAAAAKAIAAEHGGLRPVQRGAPPSRRQTLRWTALALMTVGSVGYLGSAPTLSVFGLASVFLYVLPAIVFLLPVSLVAAELASGWPGGVYNWVGEGISPPMGLLAVWCEFSQTIFYYPALLAYVASTLAYAIDPSLASNGVYNAAVIIALFWGGVLITSRGVELVARLSASGTVIGTLIPGALLVALGAVYLLRGYRSAAPMTTDHLLPPWHGIASIVLIVNSFFTYAGVEVNAVHVNELRNPAREFPKSIFLATALVLAIFIGPTLAISWVIPAAKISFTAGVMQAFNSLLTRFGLSFGVPLIAIALAVGALAGMITWLDGPSEGLLKIGRQQGFLPPYFQKVNGKGVEVRILSAQGTVITVIALFYAFVPSVSRAYWIFAAMATQVYLIMYVLMFIAAMRLRRSQPDRARVYRVPALRLLCVVGAVSSVLAFVIGFIAPSQFGHLNPVSYAVLILAGILIIGIIPPFLMDRFRRPGWKEADRLVGERASAGFGQDAGPTVLVAGGGAGWAACSPVAWALMKAAIRSFSSSIRLKPPWLPGTMATSACGMRLPRARASAGVSMALRAPATSRTGTSIARSSSSVRTPGNFGSAW